MNDQDPIKIEPATENFRGYIVALDQQIEANGSISIPFIAFAKMAGADVDKIFVKEDFEKFMGEVATEYNAEIKKYAGDFGDGKTGFGI